jgi:hypothetical protein
MRASLRCPGLLFVVFLVAAAPAAAQNLLVNPGFDRDLSGWDVRTEFYPPFAAGATAQWAATDAQTSGVSGSVRFRLEGAPQTVNRILLSQCVAAVPGRRYDGGGTVRTDDQLSFGVIVRLELFTSAGCAGNPVVPGPSDVTSLQPSNTAHNNSGGHWLPATVSAIAGTDARSVRFTVGIDAVTLSPYASSFDGLFDDAFLDQADPAATWILPSSARVPGFSGSNWTTTLTLANPGAGDAFVTVKFLGHDADGRNGDEKSVLVAAGALVEYPDVLGSLFGRTQDYGAIRVASSSVSLTVQSETSTPEPSGGGVGQALPAFSPAEYASASPKSLAPIRENAAFRTNLILANPTEIPVTAHVVLFAADGTAIGAQDVALPPLGMTQVSRVAALLGAPALDAGRIAVSTPTPGGLVAAYASVIDNVTNDPRTLLPR